MATGEVTRFIETKGCGFIRPDDGGVDVFVHITAVERAGGKTLTAGQRLGYDTVQTLKGLQAENLEFIEEAESGPAERRRETSTPRRSAGGSGALRKRGTGRKDGSRGNQNAARHTITDYEPDDKGLKFDTCHKTTDRRGNPVPVKVESLKVTDRYLTARPGSVFKETGSDLELVQYDPDVSDGLSATDVDQNPYNFVPWLDPQPMDAEEPSKAKHHKKYIERYSGHIDITFTARTPIFVPASGTRDNDDEQHSDSPQEFFHCWNGQSEHYAIPGASVKGAVRALFEALTNSRAGVTDETELKWPPLYRRRSFRLFKVISLPSSSTPGQVEECDYNLYCNRNGREHWKLRRRISPPFCDKPYFANLFWVNPSEHEHKWEWIRFRPKGKKFGLCKAVHDQFESMDCMDGHPHLKMHGKHGIHGEESGNAAYAARKYYKNKDPKHPNSAPEYSSIRKSLFKIKEGDLIFGILDKNNKRIRCFGRNVNFLWPAELSALQLMGNFASRKLKKQNLSGSDPSEATFGFAGVHGDGSHPFRSRVRFETFWGPALSDDELPSRPCLQLMPLTAPSGTKAKSRPLYLNPGPNGKSVDHDAKAKLRGRKFYWHQKGKSGNLPLVHRFDELNRSVPDAWKGKIESQLPAPIRPLPEGTTFKGKIHFNNLTSAELGALLVAVSPDLAFEESDWKGKPRYGIKIGKGKPRGLGSVTSDLTLRVDDPPRNIYSSLDAQLSKAPHDDKAARHEVKKHVCSYKKWLASDDRPDWNDLELAKALKKLLRLPDAISARVYPPQFMMYGWLPDANDPDGSPRGPRPKAMTPAHEMK